MWHKMIFAVGAGIVAIVLVLIHEPASEIEEIVHESTRIHLNLYGSSINDYHQATGKWPAQIGNLAMTSLPTKSPHWRTMLDSEVDVIVWHKTLKPYPKDNADHILVYHNKGLIAERGDGVPAAYGELAYFTESICIL